MTQLTPTASKSINSLAPNAYKKADVQVYQTQDYQMFRFAKGNRAVNHLHLIRLIESMRKNYLFTIIMVNKNFEVIDGQHRLEACKSLNLVVYFTIVPDYGLKEMQILNLNGRNWTSEDYLSGFIDMGKQDYIDYKRFKSKYKFGHQENVLLLAGSVTSAAAQSANAASFNQGAFKISNYEEACRIADKIWELEPVFKGFRSRGFVTVITQLIRERPKFKINEFIKKCQDNPSLIKKCATNEQYLDMIEYIYNYRRVEKIGLKY